MIQRAGGSAIRVESEAGGGYCDIHEGIASSTISPNSGVLLNFCP